MKQTYQAIMIHSRQIKSLSSSLIFIVAASVFLSWLVRPSFAQEALKKGINDMQKVESAVLGTGEKVPIMIRPKLVYDAADLKDPFDDFLPKAKVKPSSKISGIGTEQQAAPLPSFTVQGLIWGGSLPQAVIDDQVVKVGDVIQDAEIVEISKEGIKVLYNKKIHKLAPPSSSIADANTSKPN
ncbi:MAG: hypothetical protein WC486_03315 [Candidatus Omnitrophota bacterium]